MSSCLGSHPEAPAPLHPSSSFRSAIRWHFEPSLSDPPSPIFLGWLGWWGFSPSQEQTRGFRWLAGVVSNSSASVFRWRGAVWPRPTAVAAGFGKHDRGWLQLHCQHLLPRNAVKTGLPAALCRFPGLSCQAVTEHGYPRELQCHWTGPPRYRPSQEHQFPEGSACTHHLWLVAELQRCALSIPAETLRWASDRHLWIWHNHS